MENTPTAALVVDPQHIEHNTHTHDESSEISMGFYVASFLILLIILGIFGDLFVFIIGLIGAVVIYAGYFTEKAANEEH